MHPGDQNLGAVAVPSIAQGAYWDRSRLLAPRWAVLPAAFQPAPAPTGRERLPADLQPAFGIATAPDTSTKAALDFFAGNTDSIRSPNLCQKDAGFNARGRPQPPGLWEGGTGGSCSAYGPCTGLRHSLCFAPEVV